jgi:hypothetical protein
MSTTAGTILFSSLFFGVAIFIFVATGRQRKIWKNRPAILRSLASRRGFQFVENPGKPADLIPLRPVERKGNVRTVELPAAVRGRTLDTQFVLCDLFTEALSGLGSHKTVWQTYETFVTFTSSGIRWPHFEFAAIAHVRADSLTGQLMSLAVNAAGWMMEERGLTHVPIPEQPGVQLFVHDPAIADRARDALTRIFAERTGWWVGAKDETLTVMKTAQKSATMAMLVPESQLEPFLDEAIEVERALRTLATRP